MDRPQQQIKAKLIADAFLLTGVDAVLPGAGDLALGLDFVKGLPLPWVAANLDCGGENPFPASRVVTREGMRVAFIGVAGKTSKGCTATDPIPAVRAAIAGVTADLVVVLSGESVQDDDRLVAELPTIQFVVNGQDRQTLETPRSLPNGGLLLASGSRSKQVGVLSMRMTPGATVWRDDAERGLLAEKIDRTRERIAELKKKGEDDRTKRQLDFWGKELAKQEQLLADAAAATGPAHHVDNKLVDLGTDVADDPATQALVEAAKTAMAAAPAPVATGNGPFLGSDGCVGCHAAETTQWKTTPHAHAWATLAERRNDPGCFSCHVTGAMHVDGPRTATLPDVGCEACHGPGKAHAADHAITHLVKTPGVAVCTTCHDGDRDGGRFEFDSYLTRVIHN